MNRPSHGVGVLHTPTYRGGPVHVSAGRAYHHPSPTVSVTNRCWPPAAFRFTWLGLGVARQRPTWRLDSARRPKNLSCRHLTTASRPGALPSGLGHGSASRLGGRAPGDPFGERRLPCPRHCVVRCSVGTHWSQGVARQLSPGRCPAGARQQLGARVPAGLPVTKQEVDLAGRAASVAGKRRSVVPPALRRSRGNRQALAQCM